MSSEKTTNAAPGHGIVMWHFKGQCYEQMSPEKLGTGYISATRVGGGSYSTVLPISEYDYRREHKTKARIEIEEFGHGANITIWDDYGHEFLVVMDGCDDEWMSQFKASAKASGLCKSCGVQFPLAGNG